MRLRQSHLLVDLMSMIPVYFSPSSEIFHNFSLRLESGYEAFSNKASETWELRWVLEINIPEQSGMLLPKTEEEHLKIYQELKETNEDFLRRCISEIKKLKDNA